MYVGQEVVAIRDHPLMFFKKGDSFIITSVSSTPCCNKKVITIGITDYTKGVHCVNCNGFYDDTNEKTFLTKYFVPIDYSKAKKVEFTQIVEEYPILAS